MLESGAINVEWTYKNGTGLKVPFEVPPDIVNPHKDVLNETGQLKDFVTLNQPDEGPVEIVVHNRHQTPVFKLNGMILSEYLNMFETTALAANDAFQGIMGLGQVVDNSLFLKDGVYSLWAYNGEVGEADGKLPGKNSYSTFPYYMARAQDSTWFGVFTNLPNA